MHAPDLHFVLHGFGFLGAALAMALGAGYSEKDGSIKVTAHRGLGGPIVGAPLTIYGHKDAEFDTGGNASQQLSAGRVAFIAHGANKPMFKFTLVNGPEALALRRTTTYAAAPGILGYWPCTIVWAFRRPGLGSLTFAFHGCELGKGGTFKASDGAGLEGGAVEFPMLSAETSTNGAAYILTA